jgi:uncharacterized protein (TIGR02118 family)
MLFAHEPGGIPEAKTLAGLARGLVHNAAQAHDPFLDDGAPPRLALQLYFHEIAELERAVAGPLRSLAPDTYEAMSVRRFPVSEPNIAGEPWCTYLVAYDGPAQDPQAWHAHYLAHHPAMMAQLPGIRELEIYTAVDWVGKLGGERKRSLQRNKVAFDSPAALTAALNSPLREQMRADFAGFPPFGGRVTHFPMLTRRIPGSLDPW